MREKNPLYTPVKNSPSYSSTQGEFEKFNFSSPSVSQLQIGGITTVTQIDSGWRFFNQIKRRRSPSNATD